MKNGVTVSIQNGSGLFRWQLLDFGFAVGDYSGVADTREDARKAGYKAALSYTKRLMLSRQRPKGKRRRPQQRRRSQLTTSATSVTVRRQLSASPRAVNS